MEGYDATTYGAAFADVYDEWYDGISDVAGTVTTLLELAGGGPVLELAVGTGRLAVPLAAAGGRVTGIDASREMLARLSVRDPHARVTAVRGDMVGDLPDGPFALAFVAYNSLFNLTDAADQQACFTAVASRLAPGGRFAVEAVVPDEPFLDGDDVSVRTLTADKVILAITRNSAAEQSVVGQFVELTNSVDGAGGVRLRPWAIRYATIAELDRFAATAGLECEHRWEDFTRAPFTEASPRHVSVYRRPA